MYNGKIYYKEQEITVEKAVELNLIEVDENGDIWLKNDVMHLVVITEELRFE